MMFTVPAILRTYVSFQVAAAATAKFCMLVHIVTKMKPGAIHVQSSLYCLVSYQEPPPWTVELMYESFNSGTL